MSVLSNSDEMRMSSIEPMSKSVTFHGVKKRKHRRSKSLPTQARNIDVPFTPPRLLQEEVKELHKKHVILDTGIPEVKGWSSKKEKNKLKGAVATVLDEKRKEQLATIKNNVMRAKELEAFLVAPPSLIDLQEKHVLVVVDEQDENQTPKIVRANVPIKQTRDPPAPLRKHRSFGPSSRVTVEGAGSRIKFEITEETHPKRTRPSLVRSRSSTNPVGHGLLEKEPRQTPSNPSNNNNNTNSNSNNNNNNNTSISPPHINLSPESLKSKTSWEKIFSKPRRKSTSPRDRESVSKLKDQPKTAVSAVPVAISPRIKERCETLEEWLKARPTWEVVETVPVQTQTTTANPNPNSKSNFRNSTEALELLMKERPSWKQVIERGIGKDEKDVHKKEKYKNKLRYFFRDRKQKQAETGPVDIYYELAVSAKKVKDGQVSPPPEVALTANPGEDDPSEPETPREINFFDIEFLGSIGGGCYGNVYEGYLKGERRKVAVKILKNSLAEPEKAYKREVEALKRTIKSPYTVNLRGYCTDPYYCIVTDLCDAGSLETIMRKQGVVFTTEQAVRIAKQVAEGMKYLHGLKPPLLHRDISAGNIFLHPNIDGKACLGDFGIAIAKTRRGKLKYSQNGNPRYRAPEVSNGEPYSRKADVYSFGNLFYELLTGNKPFSEHEDNQVAEVIAKGGTPDFSANCNIDPRLKKLVKKCWSMSPDDRPSFKKIVAQLEEYQASAKQEKKRKEKEESKISNNIAALHTPLMVAVNLQANKLCEKSM